jgi:hypothetical protein
MTSLRKNPPPGFRVEDIAERCALEFARHRRNLAEREILFPLGLDYDSFIAVQKDMSPRHCHAIN